ncbi:MAG: PAS domain S-box protein [Candidatus Saccharibacteria bacterium]
MKINIIDLIDFERINTLLEGFNKSTGFVTAILDLEGRVLSKSGWRNVCVDFHRVNHLSAQKCHTSDTVLASKMAEGEKYHFYNCLNGLVDVAVPIVIKGEHIANLFSGQFFFEPPNMAYFTAQAKRYGFDEVQYLERVKEVPIVNEERVKTAMDFLLNMTELVAQMTLQRMEQVELNETLQQNQAQLEAQNRQLQLAKEKAEQSDLMHSSILHTSMDGFWLLDTQLNILEVNNAYVKMSGHTEKELLTMKVSDVEAKETLEETREHVQKIETIGFDRFVTRHRRKDGSTFDCEVTAQYKPIEGGQIVEFIRDITDRVKAREEIERSERMKTELLIKFNEAQQSAKIGNWDWDLLADTVWWSDEMYRIFGLESDNYIPSMEANSRYIHQEDMEIYEKQVWYAIHHKIELNADLRIVTPKGKLKYCNSRARVEVDAQGVPVRFYGTFADISERKMAEIHLQQSEDRLSKIFHSSPSAIIVSRVSDGMFIDMNEAACQIYGYPREELIGHTSLEMEIIDPDERKKLTEALTVYGSLRDYEVVVHSRSQGDRYVLFFMEILTIDNELCMLTSMIDITERKRAEEALMRSEKEFRTLAESMPQIVWITGPEGLNIYFNHQWVDYTGLSLEESYGEGWILPFHPDDQQKAWAAWHNAVSKKGIYSVECRLRSHDGIYRWWLIRGIPVLDDKGNIAKWFGTCTDIQEIKEAEEKIKAQLNELRRWQEVTIDREDRILELKSEVNELLTAKGEKARYGSNPYPINHES